MAREVLARHDVSAPVRTERWSPRDQEWRDAADEPAADIAAERQAVHEYRQEQEREMSRDGRFPAWQVRVELPSHRDVVALAGHLAAQGWRVRPRRRHLSSGRTAKTTLRASSGSSPVTAALMRMRPSGSGGSAIPTCMAGLNRGGLVDPGL